MCVPVGASGPLNGATWPTTISAALAFSDASPMSSAAKPLASALAVALPIALPRKEIRVIIRSA